MRRQRSVSFYADSQEEFIEEYNKRKSISERRRCRSNSYTDKNSKNDDKSKNNEILRKKKIFQSYDDLELEQLGVNSTYQITKMEKEDIQVNEDIGIIKKLYNINLSFKQNNNNSFFSNLTPLTKNIIGKFGRKNSKKIINYIKDIELRQILNQISLMIKTRKIMEKKTQLMKRKKIMNFY